MIVKKLMMRRKVFLLLPSFMFKVGHVGLHLNLLQLVCILMQRRVYRRGRAGVVGVGGWGGGAGIWSHVRHDQELEPRPRPVYDM